MRALPALYIMMPEVVRSPLVVCNSLFGCVAGHPMLQRYLALARRNLFDRELVGLAARLPAWQRGNKHDHEQRALNARLELLTTYAPFSEAFCEMAAVDDTRTIAMPPQLFNSLDCWWSPFRFAFPLYWKTLFRTVSRHGYQPYRFRRASPNAFAVHYSSGSWISNAPSRVLSAPS